MPKIYVSALYVGYCILMSEYDDELDCSGLNCPMPILKTKMKIDKMNSGQVLKVIATDPGVCNDMPAWASKVGPESMAFKT